MPQIRVLFFNVANGLLDVASLKRAIEQSKADIIGLAEVSAAQAEAVRALQEGYPFQYLNGIGIPGKGLLSRFPLRNVELVENYPGRPDLRSFIRLGQDHEAQELQVIVAHPPPQRNPMRRAQLKALRQLATTGEPCLLIGDFNMVQAQAEYRGYVIAGLIDAFREAGRGRGFTYPVRRGGFRLRPLLRIDFIWHTKHLRAERAWVGADYGSDHLPVFADLAW